MTRKAVCAPLQIGLSRKTSEFKKKTKPKKVEGKITLISGGKEYFRPRE